MPNEQKITTPQPSDLPTRLTTASASSSAGTMRCTSGTVKACVFLLLVTLGKVDVAAPVRNRTEDLPIVFPDENVPAGAPSPRREVRNDSFGSGRTSSQNEIPESLLFRMRDVKNLTDFVSQFLEGYRTYQEAFQGSAVAAPHIAYLYEGHGNQNLLRFLLPTTTSSHTSETHLTGPAVGRSPHREVPGRGT